MDELYTPPPKSDCRERTLMRAYNETIDKLPEWTDREIINKIVFVQAFDALVKREGYNINIHHADFERLYREYDRRHR